LLAGAFQMTMNIRPSSRILTERQMPAQAPV